MEGQENKIGSGKKQNLYLSNMNSSPSFWEAAWRRLKKNKGALLGLVLIAFAVFIALFGYFLAPDPSPFANRIVLEIGGEKPGYSRAFLLVKKEQVKEVGPFTALLSGRPDRYDYIPLASWQDAGDSIVAQRYIDEGVSERLVYAKSALAKGPVLQKRFYQSEQNQRL